MYRVIAGDVEAAIAGEPLDGDRQMFNGSDHQGRPHCHNRSRTGWSTSAYCAQPPRSDRRVFAFDAMMIGRNRQGGKAAGRRRVSEKAARPPHRKWVRRQQGSDQAQELVY